jgi:hypothetical protein
MNLTKILADLRQEREQIDEAILSLERLSAGSGPRRGRPLGGKVTPATKSAAGD